MLSNNLLVIQKHQIRFTEVYVFIINSEGEGSQKYFVEQNILYNGRLLLQESYSVIAFVFTDRQIQRRYKVLKHFVFENLKVNTLPCKSWYPLHKI